MPRPTINYDPDLIDEAVRDHVKKTMGYEGDLEIVYTHRRKTAKVDAVIHFGAAPDIRSIALGDDDDDDLAANTGKSDASDKPNTVAAVTDNAAASNITEEKIVDKTLEKVEKHPASKPVKASAEDLEESLNAEEQEEDALNEILEEHPDAELLAEEEEEFENADNLSNEESFDDDDDSLFGDD